MSSTLFKNINDRCFKITFRTSKFKSEDPVYSEINSHSGLKWRLSTEAKNGYLNTWIECLGNESNLWKVEVKDEFKLIKKNGEPWFGISTSPFTSDKNCWGYDDYVKMSELDDGYIENGYITIEYTAEIKMITGMQPKRTMNFDEKDELSDVELVVGVLGFHVSKAVLGSFSPVFRAMFRPGFKEATAKTILLQDVDALDLDMFLQMIYHCHVEIDDSRVEGLLKLADRYNVFMIIEKCERFLVNTKEVNVEEKLRLAEQYKLSELQHSCLVSIKTMKELNAASSDYEKMGELTAKALLKKSKMLYDSK